VSNPVIGSLITKTTSLRSGKDTRDGIDGLTSILNTNFKSQTNNAPGSSPRSRQHGGMRATPWPPPICFPTL